MAIFKRDLAGPGYVVLNAIRVLNIISLTSAATASVVMLVKTFIKSKFFFFDALSHVITFFFAVFLILSETGLFRNYFARNFPLLSLGHGFVFLGSMMCVIGVHILGNLNKEATSQKNLGMSFWQIVISSGILVCIIGVFNIIASYVFRKKSLNVTARMVRAYGAVASQKAADIVAVPPPSSHAGSSTYSPSVHSNTARSYGPDAGLPSYHGPEMQRSDTTNSRLGLSISRPVNHDPEQFAKFQESEEIRKPDPAAHPAFNGNRF
ncbi:MAG: hypothetical protein MMC23_009408 [Stictis urceolatum]|nr:hypothetical protein [Stictis urceolata]